MIADTTATRLCPSCANSVAENASDCPYCKADLSSELAPQWLKRDQSGAWDSRGTDENGHKFPIPQKILWLGGMLTLALIAFFAGRYMQGSELTSVSQANLKQLQSKDQMIQSQEAQLAQTRQQLKETSDQLEAMKIKLDEGQKVLALAQHRRREADRLRASTPPPSAVRQTASRSPASAETLPRPAAGRATTSLGPYETIRATAVHEDPSSTSRVISQISGGTKINVVSSAGGWLEVRSRRGNPPGYVRAEDARPIGGAS